jgi:hypothetical protein
MEWYFSYDKLCGYDEIKLEITPSSSSRNMPLYNITWNRLNRRVGIGRIYML